MKDESKEFDSEVRRCIQTATTGDWAYNVDSDLRPWKSSIHMPRAASRLTLEILSICVERVQDITEADAKAEGILIQENETMHAEEPITRYSAKAQFQKLWDDTNGKGAWDRNDWVWVIEFKKVNV